MVFMILQDQGEFYNVGLKYKKNNIFDYCIVFLFILKGIYIKNIIIKSLTNLNPIYIN